jgi:signal peptidase II
MTHDRLRALLVAAILLATVGCDQAAKHYARSHVPRTPHAFLRGHVQLVLAENRGSFLSLGDHLPPSVRFGVFTAAVAVALLIGAVVLFRHRGGAIVEVVAAALVIGGGFGNLFDRAFRGGAVTDFLILAAGPLHTGIFNVADVAITAGIAVLAARAVLTRRAERNSPA